MRDRIRTQPASGAHVQLERGREVAVRGPSVFWLTNRAHCDPAISFRGAALDALAEGAEVRERRGGEPRCRSSERRQRFPRGWTVISPVVAAHDSKQPV